MRSHTSVRLVHLHADDMPVCQMAEYCTVWSVYSFLFMVFFTAHILVAHFASGLSIAWAVIPHVLLGFSEVVLLGGIILTATFMGRSTFHCGMMVEKERPFEMEKTKARKKSLLGQRMSIGWSPQRHEMEELQAILEKAEPRTEKVIKCTLCEAE